MDTNGSYRKESDWQEIAQVMSDDDSVPFSSDGNPTNFIQSRVNDEWFCIVKMAYLFLLNKTVEL